MRRKTAREEVEYQDDDSDAGYPIRRAYKKLRRGMDSVLAELVSLFAPTLSTGNPSIPLKYIISGTEPLESIADTRLLRRKLDYLQSLDLDEKVNITLHELPIIITSLVGIYIKRMEMDNDTILVDSVQSGVEFLIWWFRTGSRTKSFIQEAFKEANRVLTNFERFQKSVNYDGFDEAVLNPLLISYKESIESINKHGIFSGVYARFQQAINTGVLLNNLKMTVKMAVKAAALLLLDYAIPLLIETFINEKELSTKYRIWAYGDLLVCTLCLEFFASSIIPEELRGNIAAIATNVILLYPIVLKGVFASNLFLGGYQNNGTTKVEYTVVDTIQGILIVVNPVSQWMFNWLSRLVSDVISRNVMPAVGVIPVVFKEMLGVVTSAEALRQVLLTCFVVGSTGAMMYEYSQPKTRTRILSGFDAGYDRGIGSLYPGAREFVKELEKRLAMFPLISSFVADKGNIILLDTSNGLMRFAHSSGVGDEIEFDNTPRPVVRNSTGDRWKMKMSLKCASVTKIAILSLTFLATSTIQISLLPVATPIQPLDEINIKQFLVNNLGYEKKTGDGVYEYNYKGVLPKFTDVEFDYMLNEEGFKGYEEEIKFLVDIWKTDKTATVDKSSFNDAYRWIDILTAMDKLNGIEQYKVLTDISSKIVKADSSLSSSIEAIEFSKSRIMMNTMIVQFYDCLGRAAKLTPQKVAESTLDSAAESILSKENIKTYSILKEEIKFARDALIIKCLEFIRAGIRWVFLLKFDQAQLWILYAIAGAVVMLMNTWLFGKLALKLVDIASKPGKGKKPEPVELADTSAIDGFKWLFPLCFIMEICVEMGRIALGQYAKPDLEFWDGYWNVSKPITPSRYYLNGRYYANNGQQMAQDAFMNFNYVRPRPIATRLITEGVYIKTPVKPGSKKGR